MGNNLIVFVICLFGIIESRAQQVAKIDTSNFLYSVPTISSEIAKAENTSAGPEKNDLVVYEDNWCQVEFLLASQLEKVKTMLTDYKKFESENRTKYGWKNVYVRIFEKESILSGKADLNSVMSLLKQNKNGNLFLSSTEGNAKANNGFSIYIGGNISLYGTTTERGIHELCAEVGQKPDNKNLMKTFSLLNEKCHIILVDWIGQVVLIEGKSNEKYVWKP